MKPELEVDELDDGLRWLVLPSAGLFAVISWYKLDAIHPLSTALFYNKAVMVVSTMTIQNSAWNSIVNTL